MSDQRSLSFVSLEGIPEVAPGADLAEMHLAAAEQTGLELTGGVLVICQKIVSKAEGRLVNLPEVDPTDEALRIAEEHEKDPRHIEVILRETRRIVRRSH
ncbi:MAG: coenzyme F420-0:L-glutamate ligase, partial [Deltaproteobacteria bacterium]|nr:coenzyme F420-0:L-glutamate ligase [Deltaproteobacteria bacterium]